MTREQKIDDCVREGFRRMWGPFNMYEEMDATRTYMQISGDCYERDAILDVWRDRYA